MGLVIYGTNTLLAGTSMSLSAESELDIRFDLPCQLNRGAYTLTVGLHDEVGISYDWIDEFLVFEVVNERICDGLVDLDAQVSVHTQNRDVS